MIDDVLQGFVYTCPPDVAPENRLQVVKSTLCEKKVKGKVWKRTLPSTEKKKPYRNTYKLSWLTSPLVSVGQFYLETIVQYKCHYFFGYYLAFLNP